MGKGWNEIVSNCVHTTPTGEEVATLACAPALFQNLIHTLLAFSGTVAVIFIIFAGYKFVTSGGDPKQAAGARATLTYAVIGLLIILMSFFFINLVSYLTRVDCIKEVGFNNCR